MLEAALTRAVEQIRTATADLDLQLHNVQVRDGALLAQEVRGPPWRPDSRGGFRIGCLGWHSDTPDQREKSMRSLLFWLTVLQPAPTVRVCSKFCWISVRRQLLAAWIATTPLKT